MKEIFENIKDMVLPAVIVIGIFSIILGVGMPRIKQQVENSNVEKDYSSYQDIIAYKYIAERQAPSITYNNEKCWTVNEEIPISQAFLAKDSDGNILEIKVLEIRDNAGNDVTGNYQVDRKIAVFTSAGNYYFKMKIIDAENRVATKTIALVVDN